MFKDQEDYFELAKKLSKDWDQMQERTLLAQLARDVTWNKGPRRQAERWELTEADQVFLRVQGIQP